MSKAGKWWLGDRYSEECGEWTARLSREAAHVLSDAHDGIEAKLRLWKPPATFAVTKRQFIMKGRW